MRVSLKWLREFVPFTEAATDLAHRLTMAGFEVEDIEDRTTWAEGVVIGKILTCEPHPNADKLRVCQVDIGENDPYTIVCGAPNAAAGMFAPVAPPGTYLSQIDLKIRPTKLRGVMSSGMICSLAELGLAKESEGIHSFDNSENTIRVGQDVRPLLGLDDVILDVTSTANRADALSMIGIAREVAALTQLPMRLPDVGEIKIPKSSKSSKKLSYPLKVNLNIADAQACPAYVGTVIAGVKIGPSPAWFQERLVAAGMRPINNVVDITNYILLTWGQPLHAFDADRLQTVAQAAKSSDKPRPISLDQAFSDSDSLSIGVRLAQAGETLKTLDEQDRTLTANNLVITGEDYPIALAGVMGGAETEVHDGTVNLFLEAALFNPVHIRRSARDQGLRTEASTRYERGVNPAELFQACDHALDLIQTLTGGAIQSQVIFDQRPPLTRTIALRLSRLQQLLGPVDVDGEDIADLPAEVVEKTLKALGFSLAPAETEALDGEDEAGPAWVVTVPPYRFRDIEREIDLIEEVARLYGYDRFIDTLPNKSELGYLPLEQSLTRQIRAACRGAGLTELVHYSWVRPDAETTGKITVVNPLVAEFSALRSDIITNLLNALQFNLEQGNPPLNGFEIGRVFTQDDEGLWETDHLGGVISGDPMRGKWVRGSKSAQPLAWYEAKGILTSIFDRLGLTVEYQPDRRDDRFHPGRTASLWLNGERLGTFGQLHPQLRQERDFPEAVYVFELDMEVLLDHLMQLQARQIFRPYSTYPATDRDLALYAPVEISVAELERVMVKAASAGKQDSLLESVELFDQYSGEGVPPGQRSLAFRLIYRANERTLTEADVTPVHQAIRDALQDKFAVTLRS